MRMPISPKYPTANRVMRGSSSRRAPPRTPRRVSSTQMTIALVRVATTAPVTPCTRAKADHWLAKRLTSTIGSEKNAAHIWPETRADAVVRNVVTQRRIHREAMLLRISSTAAMPARTRLAVLAEASARPIQDRTAWIGVRDRDSLGSGRCDDSHHPQQQHPGQVEHGCRHLEPHGHPVGAPLAGAEQRKGTPDLTADRQGRSGLRRCSRCVMGRSRSGRLATLRHVVAVRDERTSGAPARASRRATTPTTVPLVGARANWMSRASLAAWAPGTGERCPCAQSAVRRSGRRHPLLDRPQHYTRHDRRPSPPAPTATRCTSPRGSRQTPC